MNGFSTNPADYRVIADRESGLSGELFSINIGMIRPAAVGCDGILCGYEDDSLARILRSAAEWEKSDPNDGKLPSDEAIIRAAMADCGIQVDEAPGCGDGGGPLAEDDARRLVDQAIDAAARVIQDALGVASGDAAAQYFSGEGEAAMRRVLLGYVRFEERMRQAEG